MAEVGRIVYAIDYESVFLVESADLNLNLNVIIIQVFVNTRICLEDNLASLDFAHEGVCGVIDCLAEISLVDRIGAVDAVVKCQTTDENLVLGHAVLPLLRLAVEQINHFL